MAASPWQNSEVYKHHHQKDVCFTRPKYREGRKPKAVKVYTINLESSYLLVQGVPAVGVMTELIQLFALYGAVEEYRILDDYPAEEFTEAYLIKFQKIQSARAAKRKLDEKSFFGGLLHVCYAPEFETLEDTREKLQDRRQFIARVTHNKNKNLPKLEKSKEADSSAINSTLRKELAATAKEYFASETEHSSYYGYPMLPPPPQEHLSVLSHVSGCREQTISTPSPFQLNSSYPSEMPELWKLNEKEETSVRPEKTTPPSAKHISDLHCGTRFIPRTTCLLDRKRKNEKVGTNLLIGSSADHTNEVLIGPKLPDIPKVEMGDTSLNITADLIRNKILKVSSVSEVKEENRNLQQNNQPKQRRRI
ncbi:RNA-binding protein 48 [Erpetoichthys calabaricus]|uniref:RNA-binding protein 48 n=1 Tax=Erpetoichthys calabaricus TaxID=27687 RepID=UPI002234B380|nr:RNA-binding protein 48 [Erpetoichthys calabaricus]